MAFGTPVVGTVAYSAQNGTSVAPSYPAGTVASDQLILVLGQKPSTANGGTATTPSGWTLRDELTAAGGYGTTLGADTGNTNLRIYTKDTVAGGESGTVPVTLSQNNVAWAFIVQVPTDGGTISYGSSDGSDTTAGNVSVTLAANPGLTAGDLAIWAMCIPTDVTTPSQFSAHAISATGATFATPTEINEPDSGTGNDIGGFSAYTTVSSGTASAAPTITATVGGTNTNVRGPVVMLRLRETLAERTGDLAATETGDDTFAADGSVLVSGDLSATETGDDTFAASGTVTDPAIVGTLSATETGDDTLAASGSVLVQGTLAASEAGSDTLAATGSVPVSGNLIATESGQDTLSASGTVLVRGSLAASESGDDTLAASGTVAFTPIAGSMSATETGNDGFAATGSVLVAGAFAATETGSDTFLATGGNLVAGNLAATEVGEDSFAALGSVPVQGSLAATEVGQDVFAGGGGAVIIGTLTATESGSDVFAASGTVAFEPVTGSMAASEAGDDVFAAVGQAIVTGTLSATEFGSDGFLSPTAYVEDGYVEPGYLFGLNRVLVQGSFAVSEVGSDTFAATNLETTVLSVARSYDRNTQRARRPELSQPGRAGVVNTSRPASTNTSRQGKIQSARRGAS